jgi:AcrR family transcriptional regulator
MNVHSADAAKRAAILHAALGVFAKSGVDGTAVPQIAAAAGVGVGTLYRYFTSKEQLVNALFRATKLRLRARLEDGLDLTLPPRKLFAAFWARLVAFAREEPAAFQFLELQDHLAYLDAASRSVELEVLAPIWLMCTEFQKQKVITAGLRPEVAMALVWGAFVGVFKAERNGYFTASPADLAKTRDACWRALGGR